MELELKHLAPYLPYQLKGKEFESSGRIFFLSDINTDNSSNFIWAEIGGLSSRVDCKPILRPLSDLTKEIEINNDFFIPIDKLLSYACNQPEEDFVSHLINFSEKPFEAAWSSAPWVVMLHLFQWHFDVFDLLSKGLAIDINTLNK